MFVIRKTDIFERWLSQLRDRVAVAKLLVRIKRLEEGNLGDHKPVGEGVIELRVHFGPGYRVYCLRKGDVLLILLNGGDKSSQRRDIQHAKRIAKEIGA